MKIFKNLKSDNRLTTTAKIEPLYSCVFTFYRDLHILTAGVLTYTSDERFQVRINILTYTR